MKSLRHRESRFLAACKIDLASRRVAIDPAEIEAVLERVPTTFGGLPTVHPAPAVRHRRRPTRKPALSWRRKFSQSQWTRSGPTENRRRSQSRPYALNERNPPISRNTTATTGKTPAADGAIFVVSAAICVGNTMRRRPTTSESHPTTVTSTGQPHPSICCGNRRWRDPARTRRNPRS